MLKRYVLRWEWNWALESESGKEEHWLVLGELGDVLENLLGLIDFVKLIQRIGAVYWMNGSIFKRCRGEE